MQEDIEDIYLTDAGPGVAMDDTAKRGGWCFYRNPLRSLTLLSLKVLSQKS